MAHGLTYIDAFQWHGSQSVFIRHAPVDVLHASLQLATDVVL